MLHINTLPVTVAPPLFATRQTCIDALQRQAKLREHDMTMTTHDFVAQIAHMNLATRSWSKVRPWSKYAFKSLDATVI